ncbi:hypothetical protein PPERSA_08019 [Pseudocohnilembus persalinus]|uniref:Uncharacterized protein n=1 Tax=Pseudocohnilembus persalinus TaxID=266149 RepID=A0A0V0R2I1_PSEPJ|nr:hypothetical protein PPERSA_08019 [Pseudocohnilembus persalinus]|eukprot:KRX08708.1 hypothetical protein PPERSA_08019 [Pseudocohnilembus persalinus]
MNQIDSTQSNDTGFTIIKTNKADIEVINDNNQIEEERQKRLEQQEEQIRIYQQKKLERQRMLQNQKRDFKYNDFLNNRMLKRIKEELSDKHNKELIEELENY